jgi:t-SNARE complex subunit (syntaxin)
VNERELADLQARTKMMEEVHLRHETKVEEKQKRVEDKIDGLSKEFQDLKTIVVTAVATAKVKWQVLFRVAALIGVVSAIMAAVIKFFMMS